MLKLMPFGTFYFFTKVECPFVPSSLGPGGDLVVVSYEADQGNYRAALWELIFLVPFSKYLADGVSVVLIKFIRTGDEVPIPLHWIANFQQLPEATQKELLEQLAKDMKIANNADEVTDALIRAKLIPSDVGPGRWAFKPEELAQVVGKNGRAARYQTQITGMPIGFVYEYGGVKFDGFKDGKLVMARGEEMEWMLDAGRSIDPSKKTIANQRAEEWLEDFIRWSKAANGTPIEYHVAERRFADWLRELLRQKRRLPALRLSTPLSGPCRRFAAK